MVTHREGKLGLVVCVRRMGTLFSTISTIGPKLDEEEGRGNLPREKDCFFLFFLLVGFQDALLPSAAGAGGCVWWWVGGREGMEGRK